MCVPKAPKPGKAVTPAAAPAAPLAVAETLKMRERPDSRGSYGPNTARSRRSLRTDLKMSGQAGANVARMV